MVFALAFDMLNVIIVKCICTLQIVQVKLQWAVSWRTGVAVANASYGLLIKKQVADCNFYCNDCDLLNFTNGCAFIGKGQ